MPDPTAAAPPVDETVDADSEQVIVEEVLVEEVSIDGMCGVY
jgi:mycofactocin precursor